MPLGKFTPQQWTRAKSDKQREQIKWIESCWERGHFPFVPSNGTFVLSIESLERHGLIQIVEGRIYPVGLVVERKGPKPPGR